MKGGYAGVGFVSGILLAYGIDPVGKIIDVFREILMELFVVSGAIIGVGLLILFIYKILNQAEPIFTGFEAYQEEGEFGALGFILGFVSGMIIKVFPTVGIFLFIMGLLLETLS